jgi:hydroxymethylpyrimidine pyrophosphatase-like HAD family hydrolase
VWFFRAVALDLDGTLADGNQLTESVRAAVKATRAQRRMILATGRTFENLEAGLPGLWRGFDAVVTENGAVLHTGAGARPLASPVDSAVREALAERGVPARVGRVLLALAAGDAVTAAEVIAGLGLDCQVIHNRDAAMILPAGVTKGTGLVAALDELGLSAHNAIAAGDGENDLALLQAAEVGAAVANAVPSLAAHADLRLSSPNGSGVTELLTGPLLNGQQRLCPRRRWVPIGSFDDGQPVLVPGSQASVLITGDTGSGKSYLAGQLAERWIDAGYAVLIIDPEGDHIGLTQRPGVHLVDAAAYLPAPADLLAITRPGRASLVLNLSGLPKGIKSAYLDRLPAVVAAERAEHGIPHWVITDEAHLTQQASAQQPYRPGFAGPGTCIATWRPDTLPAAIRGTIDITLAAMGTPPANAPMAAPRATVSIGGQPPRPFTVAFRVSPHVRHQRKYNVTPLPSHRRFYFHTAGPQASVPAALASARAYPPPGHSIESEPAADRVAHQAPKARPARELDAINVLDSVIAHTFQAGLALQNVRPSGPAAAADVEHALGQLDEIVRQVRDLTFQLRSPDTQIWPFGADSAGGSGT